MGTPHNHTVEALAVRWIVTPNTVRHFLADGLLAGLTDEDVQAFEATPRGRQIVLRAIRIDADEVEQSHRRAAGYGVYESRDDDVRAAR